MVATVGGQAVATTAVARELRGRPDGCAVRAVLLLHHSSPFSIMAKEWSLPSFLHVGLYEFLGVLLEHLVDLVQNGVDVLGHFLVALGDLGVDGRLDLLGLLA